MNKRLFLLSFIFVFGTLTIAEAGINCLPAGPKAKQCSGYDDNDRYIDVTLEERGIGNLYISGMYGDEYFYDEPLPEDLKYQIDDDFSEATDLTPIIELTKEKAPLLLHW